MGSGDVTNFIGSPTVISNLLAYVLDSTGRLGDDDACPGTIFARVEVVPVCQLSEMGPEQGRINLTQSVANVRI